jgi:hypothetical protein
MPPEVVFIAVGTEALQWAACAPTMLECHTKGVQVNSQGGCPATIPPVHRRRQVLEAGLTTTPPLRTTPPPGLHAGPKAKDGELETAEIAFDPAGNRDGWVTIDPAAI